jgi:hypothetical protein
MKLVQRQPSRRGVQQVGEGEPHSGARGAEMLPRKQVDGDRAERHGDGLDDEQEMRARPDPPERREQDENRIDVGREPRDLIAVQIRHPQWVAVSRRPHRLHHVPEVEPAGEERVVSEHGQSREAGGVRNDRGSNEQTRARPLHSRRSTIFFQRRPRTSSLASRA